MKTEYANRFKDAPWLIKDDIDIIVGGAGGISSWLSLFLSRVNIDNKINLIVYDFDRIEEHNIGGQFYQHTQNNIPKVAALKENIKLFTGSEIETYNEKYEYKKSLFCPIMFSGFDNMKARTDMFENWYNHYLINHINREVISALPISPIFIDGRLLAEQIQIFCITNREDADKYDEEYLFADSEVEDASCTFKQTSHVASMIASLMTSFFLNHVTNNYCKENVRTIPFSFEYILPLNLVQNEVF